MPRYKKLEDILREHHINEDHLSPYVRLSYFLSSVVPYVPYPKTENGKSQKCKTPGEEKIESFLKERGIDVKYEWKLVIKDEDEVIRVLRPDFYLPDYNLVIEFNGMEGKPGQDKRYHEKNVNYDRNGVRFDIIHLHEMISGEWKAKLDRIIEREVKRLQKSMPLIWVTMAACGAVAAAVVYAYYNS